MGFESHSGGEIIVGAVKDLITLHFSFCATIPATLCMGLGSNSLTHIRARLIYAQILSSEILKQILSKKFPEISKFRFLESR